MIHNIGFLCFFFVGMVVDLPYRNIHIQLNKLNQQVLSSNLIQSKLFFVGQDFQKLPLNFKLQN